MRLTTKGRYAVTAILDLALHGKETPVVLADISMRQGISLAYLEQLFAKLKRADIVLSAKGPGGGYRLSRAKEYIFVVDIVNAVQESFDATRCHGAGNCHFGEKCLTHDLWCDLSTQIYQFLSSVSLAHLAARYEVKQIAKRQAHQYKIRFQEYKKRPSLN